MKKPKENQTRFHNNERGFTLPEVLITIALLGILVAIAVPVWQNVVNSRSVDSATNQLASDLRLASSKSTNQLADWTVAFDSDSSYQLKADGTSISRTLPDETRILSGEVTSGDNLTFEPSGQLSGPDPDADGEIEISVGVEGADQNTISVNSETSRVEIG